MALGDILLRSATPKVISNTGTPDAVLTFANLANNAGRLSARLDLGDYPKPLLWTWYAKNQCQATPSLTSNHIRYYLAWWNEESGPGDPDGDVGASDAAFSTENDLRNLKHIGNVLVDAATADVVFSASGLIAIPVRYISLVVWNASGAALTNDNTEHLFRLTPKYDKVEQS